ncbi:phosphate-starvation-inducible PsiE family protein [Melissococcus plutonius]|uniref:Protein PsiE n=2 Tax=Melissococcus plutonius TaxID=33970 RepID=F3Y9N9_MELPT|nr:phosphate-starvation-inducible PsiE family protein [Melissococcus plutonius]BAL62402.1 phosphate-starvation-inducible protein PsiE [Melissococcus plutonius DAT561]AIM24755.1 putative membrane protein [Melissococcus plutonius S1]KMT24866.1 putative membrane protein [Melissococcus plutonius]KMT26503.1 putative membrane protein [Melissococcus plutonius]KMT27753.1 putative membrane protein [Melissococcus plutonius]
MQKNFIEIKRYIQPLLDIILSLLFGLLLIFMLRFLIDIACYVLKPMTISNFTMIMQKVTSFFMLFEFMLMILRYIQEGHHIPIRYLIYICITAILRQLMIIHGEAVQTLLLALAILLLVIVLYILNLTRHKFSSKIEINNKENERFR